MSRLDTSVVSCLGAGLLISLLSFCVPVCLVIGPRCPLFPSRYVLLSFLASCHVVSLTCKKLRFAFAFVLDSGSWVLFLDSLPKRPDTGTGWRLLTFHIFMMEREGVSVARREFQSVTH